ncbi:glycoside hydrolase family 15 protein [Siphonobacter sp. SORGH_AS_0500]|uniref:glycoside hydrolase family 15 protein n=1 Tax=Siphonobacter sp. SORGH_AS_0500 TaxID=1864824 RepID=UPI002864D6D7|nr:glycoside hydrolase family 15 protein [Siphonobacter sp. SORGH_AS_0500]MDR6198034.1 GH15 family glucan-1,4-alpha-glucosidase [Siphonobacter sp. SORGH_AS_0500]
MTQATIDQYGVIGNMNTAALVSHYGSIDFLCLPRFDSPSVFTAMLDAEKGGNFSIIPTLNDLSYKQIYLTDTAILVTRFFSDYGIAEVADFMPVHEEGSRMTLIRKVTAVRGNVEFKLTCRPRFNYSQSEHRTEFVEKGVKFTAENDQILHLYSDIEMKLEENDVITLFTLKEGETQCFILCDGNDEITDGVTDFCKSHYEDTHHFWKEWTQKCTYKGRWREMVIRSAITLKLLSSHQYGSVVAAPTFALPETLGGERNWDYRYCWIRDSAFTMFAFLRLGFIDEARTFMHWVETHCLDEPLQLMYKVDGTRPDDEVELKHFKGYKDSKPVLIGNGAVDQKQMDIYGELIDTIYLFNKYGGHLTYEFWQKLSVEVEYVCDHWQTPDHGMWEIRGKERQFLHSFMMCWVALDRAIKIGEERSFPYPREKWYHTRNEIYDYVYNEFWSEEKQSFVQYKGGHELDASVLLMPAVQFITSNEPRWQKTLQAIERELKLDVLIYRYNNAESNIDGLDGEEGTFTMCSFWFVECLAKGGQVERASNFFEKILGYSNSLGLFSEQISKRGEQLGNYPQALTHLALITAAIELDRVMTE